MSLECEGAGQTCQFSHCGVFDFLVTRCSGCGFVYCHDHFSPNNHHCHAKPDDGQQPGDPPLSSHSIRTFLTCSHCSTSDIFVAECDVCAAPMCVAHRFEHIHGRASVAKRIDVPLSGHSGVSAPLRLGPLPLGAKGVPQLVFLIRHDGEIRVVKAIIGVGGSAGRLCDDVSLLMACPSAGLNCIAVTIIKNDASGGDAPVVATPPEATGSDDMVSRMVLHPFQCLLHQEWFDFVVVAKDRLAQDFATGSDCLCLLFTECNDTGVLRRTVVDKLDEQDSKLKSKLSLLIRSRLWKGIHRDPPQITSSSSPAPSSSPSKEQVIVFDDSDSACCLPNQLNLSIAFSSTKATPRGLKSCKKPNFVAVYCGFNVRVSPFVLAFDTTWSRGKLLDRILEEVGGSTQEKTGNGSEALRYLVLDLPAMSWIVAQQSTKASLSCEAIESKGALVLLRAPVTVAEGTLFASVQSQVAALYDAKKVKTMQLRECSLM